MESKEEKVVYLVARLVEPDELERAALMKTVDSRQAAGEDVAATPDGFDGRAWAIDFARQNPRLTMFAPISIACWIWLIYDLIF